jgi:thioredoxin reductase
MTSQDIYDWAHSLQDIASHVAFVHRRGSFRAHEEAVAVNYAKHIIDPSAKLSPGHSSERRLPGATA